MFRIDDLSWIDFEATAAVDIKSAGALRYADDFKTRAIVLAYAIGAGTTQCWHADGAILDWNDAPADLREALNGGTVLAAWNATFDSAIWNYSTLEFPKLEPERIIDVMVQAVVSNLPGDLEGASQRLGGSGKDKEGKRLIKLFSIDGADPREHPEDWALFHKYACQDVSAMRDVYRRTRPLPFKEWEQYWAFEHINRRGVGLDMYLVPRAEALAAEDTIRIGQRLSELTGGVVTTVNQAQRIAKWLYRTLDDAAMREILTAPPDEDEDEDENDADDD